MLKLTSENMMGFTSSLVMSHCSGLIYSLAWFSISFRYGTDIPPSGVSISIRLRELSDNRRSVYPPHVSRAGNFAINVFMDVGTITIALKKLLLSNPVPFLPAPFISSEDGLQVCSTCNLFFHVLRPGCFPFFFAALLEVLLDGL